MPLDPRAKRFLDVLAATEPPSALSLTVAQRRDALAQMMKFAGPAEPVARAEDRTLPGPAGPLDVRLYTPLGTDPTPIAGLVYFHGGGLVAGSLDTHDGVGRALAAATRYRVLSVNYRLAPEHPFPAAVDDACTAVRYSLAHAEEFGFDPKRIAVCGDSAGGTLAAVVCQALARTSDRRPALQVLLCPILDYVGSTESRREFSSGYLVDQATLEHDLLYYVPPGTDPKEPRISPLRALDLSGLPPALIHTAEFDPLRDEGRAYAEQLRLAGVPAEYTCHPGMIHLFYGLGGVIRYARTALQQLGAEIRGTLG
jgi:acetyl esterase